MKSPRTASLSSQSPHLSLHLLVGLFALASLLLTTPAAQSQVFKKKPTYPEGQEIVISGTVLDDQDEPLDNVIVELMASRRAIKWTKMRKQDSEPETVFAVTDENGRYELRWRWHKYYNQFQMRVSIRFNDHKGERIAVLAQQDFGETLRSGSPVTANIRVDDPSFLYDFRAFLETVDSDAEHKIYEERGKPDKAEQFQHPDYLLESWWYFELGLTYRFRDGELDDIESFRPVRPQSSGL